MIKLLKEILTSKRNLGKAVPRKIRNKQEQKDFFYKDKFINFQGEWITLEDFLNHIRIKIEEIE